MIEPIYSGDQRTLKITFKDSTGALEDITAQVIAFRLWDETAEVLKSVGSGITILDQVTNTGEVEVLISSCDSANWTTRSTLRIQVEKTGASGPQTLIDTTWLVKPSEVSSVSSPCPPCCPDPPSVCCPVVLTGFEDSNDSSGDVAVPSNVWTVIPNDGGGPFSNTAYLPEGVNTLFDATTGKIDPRELQLGDTIFVRSDFTITPSVNGAHIRFRYTLGDGAGAYTLEQQLGTMSNGGGVPYRFQFTDLIYMGDTNTRDNLIGLEIISSEAAVLVNAGSVVQLLGRG